MKFVKRNLLGIWNIALALIFIIDKLIEKGTITPLFLILWTGLLLSGIFVIYENTKKNKVEKRH